MAFHEIKIGTKNFTLAPKYIKSPDTAATDADYGFLLFKYDENDSNKCKLYSPGVFDLPLIKYSSGNFCLDCNILPDGNNNYSVGSSNLKFNTMYATTFHGDLSGNATSATTATTATTATNATNVNVTTSSTSSNYPLVFTSSVTAGNKRLYTDTANSLHYNPSTNTLTAPQIKYTSTGQQWIGGKTLTNNAFYPSNNFTTTAFFPILAAKTSGENVISLGGLGDQYGFFGYKKDTTENKTDWHFKWDSNNGNTYVTGKIYGTATHADNINVSAATANASYFIQFVNGATGNRKSYTDTHLLYNPSTNILAAAQVNCKLNGPIYTYVSGTNASYYISFVNGSSAGMRYSYVDSGLYYNPSTNILTTTQVNAKLNGPLQTTATSTNTSYYISFVNGSGTAMRYSYVDTHLKYNPSTNVLTTTTFKGNLYGAVQTTSTSTSASYYISFVNASTTGMRYSYVDSGLYYNPSSNLLKIDSGTVEATKGFYETSDERLKDFQEDIEVNFSYLHNIPKKYYSWKADSTYTRHIGTSAQEVQKYYPELVNTDDDGYLTMNYDKLSVVALKAIDVLHEEVAELKKENAELKERLARLEELILNK